MECTSWRDKEDFAAQLCLWILHNPSKCCITPQPSASNPRHPQSLPAIGACSSSPCDGSFGHMNDVGNHWVARSWKGSVPKAKYYLSQGWGSPTLIVKGGTFTGISRRPNKPDVGLENERSLDLLESVDAGVKYPSSSVLMNEKPLLLREWSRDEASTNCSSISDSYPNGLWPVIWKQRGKHVRGSLLI